MLHATRNWRALGSTVLLSRCAFPYFSLSLSFFHSFSHFNVFVSIVRGKNSVSWTFVSYIHCRLEFIVSVSALKQAITMLVDDKKLIGEEISIPAHHWLWKVAFKSSRHNVNEHWKSFSLRCANSKTNYGVGKIALIRKSLEKRLA